MFSNCCYLKLLNHGFIQKHLKAFIDECWQIAVLKEYLFQKFRLEKIMKSIMLSLILTIDSKINF